MDTMDLFNRCADRPIVRWSRRRCLPVAALRPSGRRGRRLLRRGDAHRGHDCRVEGEDHGPVDHVGHEMKREPLAAVRAVDRSDRRFNFIVRTRTGLLKGI